jgi:hypothetical protein
MLDSLDTDLTANLLMSNPKGFENPSGLAECS